MTHILILTGAGISAESGLGTFRDVDGLWTKYDLDEVATPEGFARNPTLVHEFYNARRANCFDATPNAAHTALGRLQSEHAGRVTIITQNVDDLHERGGATDIIHMHGELRSALCANCDHRWPAPREMSAEAPCPSCAEPNTRPDIVWFGEMPYRMEDIYAALSEADLFVAIGTSGNVYPAAGFVMEARAMGIPTLELNLEPSDTASAFNEARFGPATQIVPGWVEDVLKS
ncbi:NAD-dependent deacylase [Aliiroseovarius sp. F20344]|uniref:NAD-dependent deacylase n=1 Tax=Aliiroseovarius sp. F20344 TaxID=2926414 RepID=UPI001FF2A72C|nr:NAD-dependent deacylase [Aliiroseovarius sp. F20344]MCK0141655.1 NAD-dependent deacylase [Aliiroseovarius sp. F20344]